MNDPTDYFGLHGYRALALAVIEQALDDLVQTGDERLRREAMNWIDWVPAQGAPRQGLTFIDCIEAAGASSACEMFRQRCKSDPQGLRRDIKHYSMGPKSESRYARASALELDDPDRPVFDTQELLRAADPGARREQAPGVAAQALSAG